MCTNVQELIGPAIGLLLGQLSPGLSLRSSQPQETGSEKLGPFHWPAAGPAIFNGDFCVLIKTLGAILM